MATLAKEKNGQIQITLTLPKTKIEKTRKIVQEELAQEIVVPGFRKGKAPLVKATTQISEEKVIQNVLKKILPKYFADALKELKIKPALYPRFELISAQKDKDWQVRAVTCEIPDFNLGIYKKAVRTALKTLKKEATKEEREQKALEALLAFVKIDLPEFLVQEEVNHRLVLLVEKLEKLGLSLEKYLTSIGKSAEALRSEYQKGVQRSIKLELILSKIARQEKIKIDEKEVAETIKAASIPDNQEQRSAVAGVLSKRAVLDSLVSLG